MNRCQRNSVEDWQISLLSVRERCQHLLKSSSWTDCKFLVGSGTAFSREFDAHKLILSMTSPVFATMFNGGLPEITYPIKITDIQPNAFKSMLEYIYTDNIDIHSIDQACELCYVAKKYMLPHLLKKCMDYIWRDVDVDSALRAYEFAKLFDDLEVANKAMMVIKSKTMEILSADESLTMSLSTLLDILDQNNLNVQSEIYLFNFLQLWLNWNSDKTDESELISQNIENMARKGVSRIRFLAMDAREFADGPAQSKLLTKDEAFAILLNILSPCYPAKYPLPDGFSENRMPRTVPSKKNQSCLSHKLYLRLPIVNASVQFNNTCLTDKINFVASQDITFLGIQIPTQIVFRDLGQSSNEEYQPMVRSQYRELMFMFLKEAHNPKNHWFAHEASLVDENSILNVMLRTPAPLKGGVEYELTVTLNKEGHYFVGTLNGPIEHWLDSIKLTVRVGSGDMAVISSLIFAN